MLGFNTDFTDNKSQEHYFVDSIAEDFEHMAIAEYPDESLIVMRRKLCWEISDILYLPLNARVYEAKKKQLDPKLSDKLRNWSRVDVLLHKTFNRSLWKQISDYGQDFWDELNFYKVQKQRINNFCDPIIRQRFSNRKLKKILDPLQEITIPGSPWGREYIIDTIWCLMSKVSPVVFRNIIRVQNYPELCDHLHRNSSSVDSLTFKKQRQSNVTIMNPLFCSAEVLETESGFRVPRKVLEHPENYDRTVGEVNPAADDLSEQINL